MRFVLVAVIVFFAAGDGRAGTSLEDKIAYIIETEKLRDQLVGLQEELMLRSIEELNAISNVDLSEQERAMIMEENAIVMDEVIDDYLYDLVALYRKHLTDQEIGALYDFYKTPDGKSMASKIAAVERKAFRIDAHYIDLISERTLARVRTRLFQASEN